MDIFQAQKKYEPRCEKTCFSGFPNRSDTNQRLEAGNFGLRKKRDCTIYVAKTKVLISCAATAQLICAFVFAYAKLRFFNMYSYPLTHLRIFFQHIHSFCSREQYIVFCLLCFISLLLQALSCTTMNMI